MVRQRDVHYATTSNDTSMLDNRDRQDLDIDTAFLCTMCGHLLDSAINTKPVKLFLSLTVGPILDARLKDKILNFYAFYRHFSIFFLI